MDYFDDILNVYAYLQAKAHGNLSQLSELSQKQAAIDGAMGNLSEGIDANLRDLKRLAGLSGVPVPELQMRSDNFSHTPFIEQIKRLMPRGEGFGGQFRSLVDEAHEHGFVNTHPEDVLTIEELQHAAEFEQRLDAEFSAMTSLSHKDIDVLGLAVALHVARYYICKYLFANSVPSNEDQIGRVTLDAPTAIDTANGFLRGADFSLKGSEAIIADSVPFDLDERELDKLGNRPIGLGSPFAYLFGTLNILTDTVTSRKFSTHKVDRTIGSLKLGERVNTVQYLLKPFLSISPHDTENMRSFMMAILKEHHVLNPDAFPTERLRGHIGSSNELFTKTAKAFIVGDSMSMIVKSGTTKKDRFPYIIDNLLNENAFRFMAEANFAVLVNTIVSTVHSTMYDKVNDGDIDAFAVRTHKILILSNLLASSLTIIPLIITEDFSKMDFGGLLVTLFQLIESSRFWINVKANYIMDRHTEVLQRQNAYLDCLDQAPEPQSSPSVR